MKLADILFAPDREKAFAGLLDGPPVRRAKYLDGTDIWLVTRYQEIRTVLTDERFSNDATKQSSTDLASNIGLPEDVAPYFTHTLGTYDPPGHTRLRRHVAREFNARRVRELRPRIKEFTDELLTAMADREQADLLEALARPLPLNVICELLGAPASDRQQLHDALSGMTSGDLEKIGAAARTLAGYFQGLVEEKRKSPGSDLLSGLTAAHDQDDGRLSNEELISMSLSLLFGGRDTTFSLIGNGAMLLLTHPEQLRWVREDPDRMSHAVEELLRLGGPADIAVLRYPLEEVELGGETISPGEPVQVVYASGNRDPEQFEDPHQLDVRRDDRSHLSFGHGVHHCVGAALGRAEGEIALRTLFTRFPDLTLAVSPEEAVYQPGMTRALATLPVRPGRSVEPAPFE
ncbi:hypothetical protein AN216_14130 [Streptomyces oceani]|uniref:Cytochrome n=1 Tax=Streptomyces oceani TaxID=1075402 RepID=A0A1E7KG34_9ACTN|nr:hypothetical protein AN216_14130 [Streptomyces oceani]